jgi:peroxiredoxin
MVISRMIRIALILTLAASAVASARLPSDEQELAPIVERRLDFFDFTLPAAGGQKLNLRQYAADKKVVIVSYIAAWCKNSIQNGPVIKRLYDKYRERGLGVVAVVEYSDDSETAIHVNRIGIDYPVVTETDSRDRRKKSTHYKYRRQAGDARKWGTPFYVIIESRDLEPTSSASPLARRVFTVSGEIVESEAEEFLSRKLGGAK